MAKMYVYYGTNACMEIFGTMEAAIKAALAKAEYDNDDYIYVSHYVDDDADGWGAYVDSEYHGDATQYCKIGEYRETGATGYWEPEWDDNEYITVIKEA